MNQVEQGAGSTILYVEGICKAYGGTRALQPLTMSVRAGEVLGVVGENGAGKSTLIRILSGAETPDSGVLTINSRRVQFKSPHDATAAGIVTVYQEFSLFPSLSVAENLLFGDFPKKWGFVNWHLLYSIAGERLTEFGMSLDPRRIVKTLSVAEKQMLEIARALHRDSKVLILDEPTAVLGSDDVDRLLRIVARFRNHGVACVFVSHRLEEVLTICDRYLVLRDGLEVATGLVSETNHDDLVSKMVGREFALTEVRSEVHARDERVALEVKDLSSPGKLHRASLTVHAGEIVGLAGLRGAGRSELLMAIFGNDPDSRGSVEVFGKPLRATTPGHAIRAGIGLVPEERATQGGFLAMPLTDNVAMARMAAHRQVAYSARRERVTLARFQKPLQIRYRSALQRLATLSGGNQQKIVLSKWLELDVPILLLDEPTRGVDVGAKFAIYQVVEELRRQGVAVLLASSELQELILLCDRVIVLHNGSITGELARRDLTEESIMRLAVSDARPDRNPSEAAMWEETNVK